MIIVHVDPNEAVCNAVSGTDEGLSRAVQSCNEAKVAIEKIVVRELKPKP